MSPHAQIARYHCVEYLNSRWAVDGLWDEQAQLWLIEPFSRTHQLHDADFLQIGRPGVDGIGFGYRADFEGLWAYYPVDQVFKFLAASVAILVQEWMDGKITV